MAVTRTYSAAALAVAAAGILLAGCAASTSGSGAGSVSSAAAAGADLVAQRCTRCHPAERIDAANHDKAGWQKTVARMRDKGAELTEAEATALIEYLSSR